MIICNFQENEAKLVWDKVLNADGYMLYRKTGKNLYTSFKEVKQNYTSLFGMQGEEIKVKPFKLDNGQKKYEFEAFKFLLENTHVSDDFEIITIQNKASVRIVWTPVSKADNYKIYCNNTLVKQIRNNDFTADYLPVGVSTFFVEACRKNNVLKRSDFIIVKNDSMEISAINTNGKVLLYWNKVHPSDGYRLFKKNEKGEFGGFVSSDIEEIVVDNVIPGEVAEYKVKPFVLKNGQREFIGYAAKTKVEVYKTDLIDLKLCKAYGEELAVSWLFDGDVDGFDLFKDGNKILNIPDGLAHITMIKASVGEFQIKGYKLVKDEAIYTCESDFVTNFIQPKEEPTSYKLSVIVPAYNSQDYISRCISTVLCSTLNDIELVVVDDGSSDNTRDIITWYSEKYPNQVKKIFKQNGGVADTRNVGINFAHGDYIAFMDNDDMIRPDGFRQLYEAITVSCSDVAVSPIYRIDNDKYVMRHKLPFSQSQAIDIEDYLRLIFSPNFNNIGVWNKLYKTDLVKAHPFGLLAYEDVSWTPYILSFAEKFCYIGEVCYEWDRKIRTSTFSNVLSNRSAEEKFSERFEAFEFFYKQGNQDRKECLAYIMAKRLYGQGTSSKYSKYFDVIAEMKDELINNKFLLADKEYSAKILPILK